MTSRKDIVRAFVGDKPCVECGRPATMAYPFGESTFAHSPFNEGGMRVRSGGGNIDWFYQPICDVCQGASNYYGPRPIRDLPKIERKNGESEK